MKIRNLLLGAASVAVLTGASQAQASGPFYVSLFGGANFLADNAAHRTYTTTRGRSTTFFHSGSIAEKSQTGFVLGGAAGMHLDNWLHGLRAEAEVSLRRNKIKGDWVTSSVSSNGDSTGSSGTISGHMSTFALMANIWYDIDCGSRFKPYIGGGVGWAHAHAHFVALTSGGGHAPFGNDDSGFAYQAGAGVNYELTPEVSIGVGYRYFRGPDVDVFFVGKRGTVVPIQFQNENQSVMLTLTMKAP